MMKEFPEDRRAYFECPDKDDLYRMPYHGTFRASMKAVNTDREYAVYIPECAHLSTPAVLVIPDGKKDAEEYLDSSGWKEAADRFGFLVFLVSGEEDEQELEQMLEEMRDRSCYVVNKCYMYLAGYGQGAEKAQRLAMRQPAAFSGLFLDGDCRIPEEEFAAMDSVPSEHPYKPLSRVPMPLWMVTGEAWEGNLRVLEYWKRADLAQEEPYWKGGSRYYLPVENTVDSLIEELVGAKIRVTLREEGEGFGKTAPFRIWEEFFSKQFRSVGITNGNLRAWRSAGEWGITFETMYVDGSRREWYQYIPTVMKRNPAYRAPLVVSLHGGGNMHSMFLSTTEWIKVAEARGFMVVFPAAALRTYDTSNWLPHAAWNAGDHEEMLDDVKFIKEMLEHLFLQYSIDKTRVYASGQSMGSVMGQRLLLTLPEYFAASGTTSGVLRGGFFGDYETPGIVENYRRPIWIIMGERDIGGGTFETNPDAEKYVNYWTRRNRTQPASQPAHYKTGGYDTKVYHNSQGVPMVLFTTVDLKPHACTAQDSWFLYDEFFSKYSLNEDGKTVYMNTIIVD